MRIDARIDPHRRPPAESSARLDERHRPASTSTLKMAVSVFRGVRLLTIGDANGDIQRHSEQQPLRLEVKTSQDAALINLSNGEWFCCVPGAVYGGPACERLTHRLIRLAAVSFKLFGATLPPPACHEGAPNS